MKIKRHIYECKKCGNKTNEIGTTFYGGMVFKCRNFKCDNSYIVAEDDPTTYFDFTVVEEEIENDK